MFLFFGFGFFVGFLFVLYWVWLLGFRLVGCFGFFLGGRRGLVFLLRTTRSNIKSYLQVRSREKRSPPPSSRLFSGREAAGHKIFFELALHLLVPQRPPRQRSTGHTHTQLHQEYFHFCTRGMLQQLDKLHKPRSNFLWS